MKIFYKNPSEEDVLDYLWNWEDWLGEDTISVVDASITTGMTILGSPTILQDRKNVRVWLDGGEENNAYIAKMTIVTVGGRIKTRRAKIIIREH